MLAPLVWTWNYSMDIGPTPLALLSEVVTGASWSRRDAVADPAVASPAVARLAARSGAQIIEHTKGVAIEPATAGFAVRTDIGLTVPAARS